MHTILCVFTLLIYRLHCEYGVVNSETLTTNNTNSNGANINVLHSDVTVTDRWSITTTNEIGFHLRVSVDDTWGFIDDQPSDLWLILHNSNEDKSLTDCRLLATFSVDRSQYITTILNPSHSDLNNQIFPNCNNRAAYGDVAHLVNISNGNSRIQKATNNNSLHDMPIYDSSKMTDYNNSWPIYLRIKYYPISLGNHIIVDLFNEEWDSHLHCRYNKPILTSYKGLDAYFACGNVGDSVSITAIELMYAYDLSYAPTTAPTVSLTSNTTSAASTTNTLYSDTTTAPVTTHIVRASATTAPATTAPTASTDVDDDTKYGVNVSIIFQYDNSTLNANITTILPVILNDVIRDEIMDDCVDESFSVRVDQNRSTVFVNASIFVCDKPTQQILFAFMSNENTLRMEVIMAMADYNDTILIIAPNEFIVLSVGKIIRSRESYESTIGAENEMISTEMFAEYNKSERLFIGISSNFILKILGLIMCIAIVISVTEIMYIRRCDPHHIFTVLVFALTICNLLTDVIVSYRLCTYYTHMDDNVLPFILTISINIFIVIPYLYNTVVGSYKLYAISSHLCCLFSNLLLILSGDSYATLNIVSSKLFDSQTATGINGEDNVKIAPLPFFYHIPQITIQSIFMLYLLRRADALIIVSIGLSLTMLIPCCVHQYNTKKQVMENHKLKIDIYRSNASVADDTFTTVHTSVATLTPSKPHHANNTHTTMTPMTPITPITPYPHSDGDDKSDEDMYGEPEHNTTVRTFGDDIAYSAVKPNDIDIIESKLPELPEEHVSYGRVISLRDDNGNVNQIVITDRNLSIEVEGQQQQTGDGNTVDDNADAVEEDALLDAILTEVLKKQELDPNKIHEMNANELGDYRRNSVSNDSDKIYDRKPSKI